MKDPPSFLRHPFAWTWLFIKAMPECLKFHNYSPRDWAIYNFSSVMTLLGVVGLWTWVKVAAVPFLVSVAWPWTLAFVKAVIFTVTV